MEYRDSRKRNLTVKLFKKYLEDNAVEKREFDKDDITKALYFKQSDINNYLSDFFEEGAKDKFKIKNSCIEVIKNIKDKHDKYIAQKNDLTEEFKNIYKILKGCFDSFRIDNETYDKNINRAIELAEKLHYIYMPIYSEQMIINREYLPENNTKEYYNHFHAIEDLYYEVNNQGKDWRSIDGDINLNQDLEFKVYTARWGHEDNYTIQRTYKGWYVRHISMNGESEKNGVGAIEGNLEHDSVCYPKEGVEYAFETLWEEADTTTMSVNELQNRIQDIASWISEVEKVTHKYQPDWCLYY